MKRLFVGGPLDGKWIETGDSPLFLAWKPREKELITIGQYVIHTEDDLVRYKLMTYSSVYGKEMIYGLETSNELEVMRDLMKGYRK